MALLSMCYEKNYQIIAAHVNYGVRENSAGDQKVIIEYLKGKNIQFEVLTAPQHKEGNFQAFAREVRYDFMVELAHKYDVDEIYVAHHEDDHIETYLMQKERESVPMIYGLGGLSFYDNIKIVRPLLSYSKQELIDYCDKRKISYVIDESNLKNEYTRNRIRNTFVSKLSKQERHVLLEEIGSENEKLEKRNLEVSKLLEPFFLTNNLSEFINLSDQDMIDVLRLYLSQYSIFNLSLLEYENLVNFIRSDNNSEYEINEYYLLSKSYDKIHLVENKEINYSYTFNNIEEYSNEYFKIRFEGTSVEAVTLYDEDFPITIRNYKEGDSIQMKFGTKKVNRFFIDRKIPEYERRKWPIVLNAKQELILVPGLGCNLTHYSNNPSMFVVK